MQVLFQLVILVLGGLFGVSALVVAAAEAAAAFLFAAEATAAFLPATAAFLASVARSAWMRFSFSSNWAEVSSSGEDCPMGTS